MMNVYLVDLPGYGYAKVSQEAKEQWGKMIERYLHDIEAAPACVPADRYPA